MKRVRKALLAAALVLAFVVTAALILATVEISSPRLESALADMAGEALGVPFSTKGLSVRLVRGLTARNVALGAAGEEFLTAEKIILKGNLLQLARRRIEIESVIIEKPVITLGINGFFVPPVLPAEAEDPETGFKFSLKSAEMRAGRLIAVKNGKPEPLVEKIFIRASSGGTGKPVNMYAEADILGAARLEASGTLASISNPDINMNCSLTMNWAAGQALHPSAGGRGKSVFEVSISGRPEKLDILASGDMTGEEIIFGNAFLKPAGTRTSASATALLSYPRLQIEPAGIKLGNSALRLGGAVCFETLSAKLELDGDINLEDAGTCVTALKQGDIEGIGKLEAVVEKPQDSPVKADGRCGIRNWRVSAAGGESLDFEFSLLEETLRIKNLRGSIGGGILTGYGLLTREGEYEFTIEGADIEIENLFRHGTVGDRVLEVSGSAGMSASVKSRGKSIEHLVGEGMFQAAGGKIKTAPRAEVFLAAADMKWMLPLNYDRIRADFLVRNGILTADAFLRSEKMHIETDKAEFDLINMQKEIHADIHIPPASIEKLRESLGEIQKLLYVDARGYAHAGLVWDGNLSETAPNIPASLIRTGQKRLRQTLGR